MEPRPAILSSAQQELALVTVICFAQFLTQLSISMSLSTMNIVLESFAQLEGIEIGTSQKIWFMGSFALTLGTFILVSGRIGDIVGLKKVFIIGYYWASITSLMVGCSYYAKSLVFFIICRALQGIGYALMLPCGFGILGTVYRQGKRKNFAFACLGAAAPAGATAGCIMAGVIAQLYEWQWAFFILCIVLFILGSISFYAIPDPFKHQDFTFKEALAEFDFIGSLLGVAGLVVFNFVWNHGAVVGWGTWWIIVLLIVSVISIVSFFVYEVKFAKKPLLPKSTFNTRIGLILLSMAFGWGSFGIWQYYYWSFMMNLRGWTPISTGLTYIPLLILGILASMLTGRFINRKRAPYIIFGSMLGFLTGIIILAVAPVHQTFWRLTFGQMFLLAWGMDCSFPSASLALSDALPEHHQGMAGSLVNTVVNYSVSLFLAIASTVEINTLKHNPSEIAGYRAAFYFGIGCAAFAVVSAAFFILHEHGKGDESVSLEKASELDGSSSELKSQD